MEDVLLFVFMPCLARFYRAAWYSPAIWGPAMKTIYSASLSFLSALHPSDALRDGSLCAIHVFFIRPVLLMLVLPLTVSSSH